MSSSRLSSSRLSDDDFDSYINPTAYDLSPWANATSPSPSTAVAGPSLDSLHDLRIMNTADRDGFYGYPTNLEISGERVDPAYTTEQVDLNVELHTKAGSPYAWSQAGRDEILYDVWPPLGADLPGDPSYHLEQYSDSVTHWEDSSLYSNSPSTQSVPKAPEGPQEAKKRLDCDFCEKSFSLRHDQLRHIRTLHPNQKNVVYRCAVPGCSKHDKLFNRLDNFKKHLKKRHNSENVEEMVRESRTSGRGTITIMSPDIGSRMQ